MTQYVDPPGFAEWEASVPALMRRDPIWRTPAYRYGLWLSELAKSDAQRLAMHREWTNNADQLARACESISSNLAEGYGCLSGAERARYYGYALASTRESLDWYFKARRELADVIEHRMEVLDRIIRILTSIIPRERRRRRDVRPPDGDSLPGE